jgi:hypothetical protein
MATYKPIQSVVLTTDTNTVSFIGIDQNYTDLEIVVNARGSHTDNANFYYRVNGDTASNYSVRRLQGNGSSAVSNGSSSQSVGYIGYVDGSNSTAGIFGMTKIIINNYTSTTTKNLISKGATAGTNGYAALFISLYRGTSPITSISLTPDAGNWVAGSTFSLYGIKSGAPQALGGDVVTTDGNYWYHTFRSTQSFIPQKALTVDYLVIAGGGSGGSAYEGGGGGAGGLRSTLGATGGGGSLESAITLSPQSYTVQVGAGGTAVSPERNGNRGTNSILGTITSQGGGYGACGGNNEPGGSGGSGGGTARSLGAGAGTTGQGYGGGNGGGDISGGGGGAGGAGSASGPGGAGVSITAWSSVTGTGVSNFYAGGGGGNGSAGSAGGSGGGGASGNTQGTSGTANTGSGGGGARTYSPGTSGAGGSGLVIVRYPV